MARREWSHSGKAEERDASSIDSLFSGQSPVPDGFQCLPLSGTNKCIVKNPIYAGK